MTEKNNSYNLYHSLNFFWKKKIWFIIIPVIVAILGFAAATLFPKDGEYVGKSTVFTGSVKLEALTNPDYIMEKYGSHFTGSTEIFVPSRSYIKTETFGDNKEQITKELTKFNEQLLDALMTKNDEIIGGTEAYAVAQETRVKSLEDTIASYKASLEKTTNLAEVNNYTNLLIQAETELTNAMATSQRVRNDILVFEEPGLATSSVVKTKSYGLEGALAGLVLGILLSFIILSLWKYILEARGSKRA